MTVRTYYFDTSLSPIKASVAKAIVGVIGVFLKDIGPGDVPWPVAKKEVAASNHEKESAVEAAP